jgi:hypothetical protein
VFISKVAQLYKRTKYDGKMLLIADNLATHMTPGIIVFAGFQKSLLIRLVPHSSQAAPPLDLCIFGLFSISDDLCQREN